MSTKPSSPDASAIYLASALRSTLASLTFSKRPADVEKRHEGDNERDQPECTPEHVEAEHAPLDGA